MQRTGNDKEAESHYTKSLQVYTDLERDFPDRRQPAVIPLNGLGVIKSRRGDTLAAERLLKEAINRGEQYLGQTPDDTVARVQLCWCYFDFGKRGNYDRGEYGRQCEENLRKGLQHSSVILQKDPNLSIALHPDAMIRAALAQRCRRFQRLDETVSLLRQAAEEYETICSAAPANHDYWQDVIWLRQVTAEELGAAGRDEEFKDSVRRSYDWLKTIAPHVPDNAEPQDDLLQAQLQILLMLRKTDQADEAAELVRAISVHSCQVPADADCNKRRSVWLGFGCALSGDWDRARR